LNGVKCLPSIQGRVGASRPLGTRAGRSRSCWPGAGRPSFSCIIIVSSTCYQHANFKISYLHIYTTHKRLLLSCGALRRVAACRVVPCRAVSRALSSHFADGRPGSECAKAQHGELAAAPASPSTEHISSSTRSGGETRATNRVCLSHACHVLPPSGTTP